MPVRYGKPGRSRDEVPEEFVWGMFVRHQGGQRGWSGATDAMRGRVEVKGSDHAGVCKPL